MVKLLIADDHPIVRNGIKALLQAEESFEIVGEAQDGQEAYDKIIELKPDVAVVDMSMPVMTGMELLVKLDENEIDVNIIILSNYDDDDYILGAIKAGAKAYLLKDSELETIIDTINNVKEGELSYSQRVTKVLVNEFTNTDKKEKLTNSELKVLKELSEGNSSKMIADTLCISKRTVETHRYRILKKLGAHNVADLIRIAIEEKLLQ